ncbi:MAG: hypothetical protein IKJ68_00050 [Clostridia bacterium]|nr:hypothetical protein [Clostridia bacterium]
MEFLGTYTDQISNGKVEFPWADNCNQELIWVVLKVIANDYTETYCEICSPQEFKRGMSEREKHIKEVEILGKGDVIIDDDDMWQVPDAIADYLKTDEITFVGAYHFVEIFTEESMTQYKKFFDSPNDLLNDLLGSK